MIDRVLILPLPRVSEFRLFPALAFVKFDASDNFDVCESFDFALEKRGGT